MTALDAACESVGCSWTLHGTQPRVLELAPYRRDRDGEGLEMDMALDLEKASIDDVLFSLSKITELPVEKDRRSKVPSP